MVLPCGGRTMHTLRSAIFPHVATCAVWVPVSKLCANMLRRVSLSIPYDKRKLMACVCQPARCAHRAGRS